MSRLTRAWQAFRGAPTMATRVPYHGRRTIGKRSLEAINELLGITADNAVTTSIRHRNYPRLRAQARELAVTSPLIKRYVAVQVENIWGPHGITVQSKPAPVGSAAFSESVAAANERAWYRWCETADVSGASFDAAMAWFIEQYKVAGEAAIEIVYDRSLLYGVGVRRIDPDLIDWDFSRVAKSTAYAVVNGVEVDADRKPVAYYVLSHRKSEVPMFGAVTRKRVPARRVIVLKHGDDVRGVTPLAGVIQRADMLNQMQEALVALYRAAACKMGFLESQIGADALPGDVGNPSTVTFDAASGVIEQLPPGMKFTSWDPGQPGEQYRDLYTTIVHEIASSIGCTYAALTGDLSTANYGSLRQGELTAREGFRIQHRTLAGLIHPLYAAVINGARIAGDVRSSLSPEDLTRAEWHGRRWSWIDPLKDAQSIRELMALTLTTRTRELNELGVDARQLFEEMGEEIRVLKGLDIPTTITTAQAKAEGAPPAQQDAA